jgi:hypothetical protein
MAGKSDYHTIAEQIMNESALEDFIGKPVQEATQAEIIDAIGRIAKEGYRFTHAEHATAPQNFTMKDEAPEEATLHTDVGQPVKRERNPFTNIRLSNVRSPRNSRQQGTPDSLRAHPSVPVTGATATEQSVEATAKAAESGADEATAAAIAAAFGMNPSEVPAADTKPVTSEQAQTPQGNTAFDPDDPSTFTRTPAANVGIEESTPRESAYGGKGPVDLETEAGAPIQVTVRSANNRLDDLEAMLNSGMSTSDPEFVKMVLKVVEQIQSMGRGTSSDVGNPSKSSGFYEQMMVP